MAYKPSDFFLGVIDFFGILIPGAVLVYLHSSLLLGLLERIGAPQVPSDPVSLWIIFLIVAYILGQILLGLGVPLNRLQEIYSPESMDSYYEEVKRDIPLPPEPDRPEPKTGVEKFMNKTRQFVSLFAKQTSGGPPNNRAAAYYRAYSFVRLRSAEATAEIDRQAAEYKLFRGLVLVFLFDFPLAWLSDSLTLPRAVVMFVLLAFALWRFLFLLDWARQLTFEFYYLLNKEQAAAQKV